VAPFYAGNLARDHPPASIRSPDSTKRPTVVEIRSIGKKLTTISLRKLREDVFKLQLSLLQQMVEGGVDPHRIAVVADCARVISTVEMLQSGARER
jgi:hypothetical protein